MFTHVPLVSAIVVLAFTACGTTSDAGILTEPMTGETAVSAPVSNDLRFLREEEKLARDVYITLGDEWGLPVFTNISSSEQYHMDRVKVLLDANGVADPIVSDNVGTFTDSYLGGLFDDLVRLGMASEVGALTVGATIEDLDINDIAEMIERANDPDVLAMYTSLMCGSRNHMRAFMSQLELRGVGYEAQYISESELNDIISTSREQCGRP
jgi:hypothetical protein